MRSNQSRPSCFATSDCVSTPAPSPSVLAVVLCLLAAPAHAEPPDHVTVTFRSSPRGATVSVDGREKCKTDCSLKLYRGSHVIGMAKDGFEAQEEIIEFKKKRTINWKLVGYDGRLDVTSIPDGLQVTVTRKGARKKGKRRKTPVAALSLRPGTYVVELTDKDYETDPMEVEVTAGQGTSTELEPIFAMARLGITIIDDDSSDDAKIAANGKRLKGKGPWTLKPGKKRIVVKFGRRTLFDQDVVFEKGASVDLEVSVQEQ
jgi:hypothetical protein